MVTIAILIPTFLRPNGVLRTLEGIRTLVLDSMPADIGSVAIDIVVADNDAVNQAGLKAVEQIRNSYPWPIHSIVVADRGIPHSRNKLLKYAVEELKTDFSVFIDDDEKPSPAWLRELLVMQSVTGADVVGGSVSAEYEAEPPKWAKSLGLYDKTDPDKNGACELVDSTANVMIRNKVLSLIDFPWFNPAFALTGGEDKEFFLRLKNRGATFAWAEKANIVELVPASRATKQWVLQRSFRIGNLDMRLMLLKGNKSAVLKEALVTFVALVVAVATYLVFWPKEDTRLMAARRISRQRGKLAAFRGFVYEEYKTIHGN
jgi:glycosyltransferase involved in cell wall biosynthesis